MADSSINVTPSGSTPVDTRTVSSEHRQVIVLGDETATTCAPVGAGGLVVDLGSNNDVTVTGTVTANAGTGPFPVSDNAGSLTVDNAGTFAVQVSSALPAGTANIGDVDVLTLPALPAGTNNIGDVDILSIAAGDNNIGNVDVVTLPALSAGTNNIGDVDVLTLPALPAGTNNIGDVDVLSIIPGTGATNLGKAIDSAASATDTGVAPLAIRDDSLSALTPAEGDWVPLRVNSTGALHVTGGGGGTQFAEDSVHTGGDTGTMLLAVRRDADTTLVDTSGDYAPLQVNASGSLKVAITAGAGSGGTSLADNAGFTPGTTSFTPIGGEVDDTGTTAASENSAAAVRITPQRAFHVNLRANDGTELTVGGAVQYAEDTAHTTGDQLTIAGTVRSNTAAATSGTDGDYQPLITDTNGRLHVIDANSASALTALQLIDNIVLAEDAASASGDPGVQLLAVRASSPANTSGTNGDYEPLQVNAGRLWTSATIDAAIPAGTNNIGDVDVLTLPNVTLAAGTNTNEVVGDVAHDAAAAGNPVLIAARANTNEPTAVSADGDATHLWADLFGRLVTLPGHPNPEAPVSVNATASGDTTVISAPGASVSLYICKASVHNRDSANVVVSLQDGAGGTTRWRAELASEGGGALIDFGARGWKLTANTLLNVNLGGASSVDVNVTEYYIAA